MYRCFVTLCAVWKNKESNRGVTVITVLPTVVWLLLCLLAARSRCGYLSVYNYTDFFTTCIVDTDVSLTPVNKFTDVLFKNSHIVIYKMHSNSFSKQFFFFRKASCTGLFLSTLYVFWSTAWILPPWILCKSVWIFSRARCLNMTIDCTGIYVKMEPGMPEALRLFYFWAKMEWGWSKATCCPAMFIVNSPREECASKCRTQVITHVEV